MNHQHRFRPTKYVVFLSLWTLSLLILSAFQAKNIYPQVVFNKQENSQASCTTEDKHNCQHMMSIDANVDASLNASAIVDRHWCPSAICYDTVTFCEPCKRRYLIVIATGRSASTTLTRMLDMLPNVRMGGENNNMLKSMQTAIWDNTLEFNVFAREGSNPWSAWKHNPVYKGSHACVTQQMVQVVNPPKIQDIDKDDETILGFKTILFHETSNLIKAVQFVKESLPCARILINIRSNSTAQELSQRKAFTHKNVSMDLLKQATDQLLQAADLFGKDMAFVLDSTKWTKNISYLNEAIKWLGFHPSCHFEELLEFNTKKTYRATKLQIRNMPPQCRYLYDN